MGIDAAIYVDDSDNCSVSRPYGDGILLVLFHTAEGLYIECCEFCRVVSGGTWSEHSLQASSHSCIGYLVLVKSLSCQNTIKVEAKWKSTQARQR
jgi:hypothetical protein